MKEERDLIITFSFPSPFFSPRREERSGEGDLDWDYILKESLRHGVAPLVFDNLRTKIPKEILSNFEGIYHATAYKNMALIEESERIIKALNEKDIKAMPIKGVSLAGRIYDNIALRPFEDIDLLIEKSDFASARRILLGFGYRSPDYILPDRAYLKNHFHIPFVKDGNIRIYLELHWDFTDRYMLFTPDMKSIWTGVNAAKKSMPVLSAEDELLYLVIHLEKHGFLNSAFVKRGDGRVADFIFEPISGNRLIWFVDLWLIIKNLGGSIDWDRVLDKSSKWGAREVFLSCLSILGSLGLSGEIRRIENLSSLIDRNRKTLKTRLSEKIIFKVVTDIRYAGLVRPFLKVDSKVMFRPIRLLDMIRYYYPPSDYIKRYYKVEHAISLFPYRIYHILRTFWENVSETILLVFYFAGRNIRRRLGRNIFNKRISLLLFRLFLKKKIAYIRIREGKIPLEIADTRLRKLIGLSFRESLNDIGGMIFIFPEEGLYSFQTANMKFPIDILYLDSSMKVVSVYKDIKPSKNSIAPLRQARYVLELPSGAARDYGITSGSQLTIQLV